MKRWITSLIALAVALVLMGEARAQRRRQPGALPQPYLQSLAPLGVQAGDTVDVNLRGTDLEGVNVLWFDHPGLRALHLKGTTFRVVAATGTPVGLHDVRVASNFGISNPRTIVVSQEPTVAEKEPNNTPETANLVTLNVAVNGEIGAAADVDCFAFEAKKGQRLLLNLDGERVESRLDATLRMSNSQGREIAESRDEFGADPFLDVTIPSDGRYVVKVHDVTFKGSTDHPYRLTIGDGPHLDAIVPLAARPDMPTTFTLFGRNLGGTAAPAVFLDGKPLESTTVTLNLTGNGDLDPSYPTAGFVLSPSANRRGWDYALRTTSGTSNARFISAAHDAVVVEREPNDDATRAQEVSIPCDISASFGAPGDLDLFRFRARKGEIYWIEAIAERIGSSADPVFQLQKLSDKGESADLGLGEDTPEKGDINRFTVATVDAALRWSVPEDGHYQVAVNDLYASQRGDVRLMYRLVIRPERPDFSLFLLPDSPNQPDAVTLYAGGHSLAHVVAVRVDGFSGPIRVEAHDLPAGVSCDSVTIGPNQSVAPIVFSAATGAHPLLGTAHLVGRGRWGDRKEDLEYTPGVSSLGPDVAHEAVGGSVVWPPAPNPQGGPPMVAPRLTRGFVISVIGESPLKLTATPRNLVMTPGGRLAFDLKVDRGAGFQGPVAVTLLNPPTGLAIPPPLNIPANESAGTFAVTVPRLLANGAYTFVLQAAGPYPFSKDPNAKTKPNVNLAEPSNAVTLQLRPATATLSVKGGTIKPGGALAVEIVVTRKDGSSEPVTVALDAPAALKLKAEPVRAVSGQPVKLQMTAAADSPPGTASGVAVRLTVPDRGAMLDIDEPLALTIAK